jgi:hypothetical protein
MNRNRRKRQNNNQKQIKTKVTRCSILKRPVFEHETCEKFILKTNAESDRQENCKNCKHSF